MQPDSGMAGAAMDDGPHPRGQIAGHAAQKARQIFDFVKYSAETALLGSADQRG
jgi:hypothetical protein